MLENYIKKLGILVSIYGVLQLLGGIGLIWFNLHSLNTATEIQKSGESFGVGVILFFSGWKRPYRLLNIYFECRN